MPEQKAIWVEALAAAVRMPPVRVQEVHLNMAAAEAVVVHQREQREPEA
jgi:hypothetical protein